MKKTLFGQGSFFHGTKVELKIGDFLTAGQQKIYEDDRKSLYGYFSGTLDAAIWGGRNLQMGMAGSEFLWWSQLGN